MDYVTLSDCYYKDMPVFRKSYRDSADPRWIGHPLQSEDDSGREFLVSEGAGFNIEEVHIEMTTPLTRIIYFIVTKKQ